MVGAWCRFQPSSQADRSLQGCLCMRIGLAGHSRLVQCQGEATDASRSLQRACVSVQGRLHSCLRAEDGGGGWPAADPCPAPVLHRKASLCSPLVQVLGINGEKADRALCLGRLRRARALETGGTGERCRQHTLHVRRRADCQPRECCTPSARLE